MKTILYFAAIFLFFIGLIVIFSNANYTISNDAFIGIMASFIGAAATIIVGAQIYNSIEAKRQFTLLKKQQDEFYENFNKIKKEMPEIKSNIHVFWSLRGNQQRQLQHLLCALYYQLQSDNVEKLKEILDDMDKCIEVAKHKYTGYSGGVPSKVNEDFMADINFEIEGNRVIDYIKSNSKYFYIKERFEKLLSRRESLIPEMTRHRDEYYEYKRLGDKYFDIQRAESEKKENNKNNTVDI